MALFDHFNQSKEGQLFKVKQDILGKIELENLQ